MAFVLATSKALLCTAKAAKNFRSASRLMSVKGGSIPSSDEEKTFYALGINIAKQVGGELKNILTKDEIEIVARGFSDSINTLVPQEKEYEILSEYGPKLNAVLTGRAGKLVSVEKTKGEEFVANYLLKNPKAVKTPSGLVYNEIVAGTGEQPTINSTVNVHYHGTLIDGSVFDSSVNRGEPIKFPLKNVIQGWQEGVSLMKVGGKATLVVPSDIGYGDNGSPPVIPPGATLVFEVELLSIV